ncbi:hypothetical protein PIROE2DRAFT_1241 [Piromyces sp. E2]|nr:hypothetical protein PIROE2DRAFT_1241 [Piromyces sp. E2]|eukprot:OUM70690.1 hypothetical protein PIROE2DRAFT_1241 [Piromyces sp. E2]
MYRMPQPVGGFSPNQDYTQDQVYQMPQPMGGFNLYNNTKSNECNRNYTDDDIESEYEYITDDEGDFVEDENGAIYTLEEAQIRGLIEPATGERGIGKKLLIGTVLLGGTWMLKKQIKKKKRVKKQNSNNQNHQNNNYNNYNNNSYNNCNNNNNNNNINNNNDNKQNLYPFLRNKTQYSNLQNQTQYPSLPQYPNQTQNVYGQNGYGQPQPNYQQNNLYGTPLYPNYNSSYGYSGYCYNNSNNTRIPSW